MEIGVYAKKEFKRILGNLEKWAVEKVKGVRTLAGKRTLTQGWGGRGRGRGGK